MVNAQAITSCKQDQKESLTDLCLSDQTSHQIQWPLEAHRNGCCVNSNTHVSKVVTAYWWDLGPFVKCLVTLLTVNLQRAFTQTPPFNRIALWSVYLFHSTSPSVSILLQTDTLSMVPSSMWVANNYDVGLIKNAEPFIKPKLSQYPLTSEAAEGNQPVFFNLCWKQVS